MHQQHLVTSQATCLSNLFLALKMPRCIPFPDLNRSKDTQECLHEWCGIHIAISVSLQTSEEIPRKWTGNDEQQMPSGFFSRNKGRNTLKQHHIHCQNLRTDEVSSCFPIAWTYSAYPSLTKSLGCIWLHLKISNSIQPYATMACLQMSNRNYNWHLLDLQTTNKNSSSG